MFDHIDPAQHTINPVAGDLLTRVFDKAIWLPKDLPIYLVLGPSPCPTLKGLKGRPLWQGMSFSRFLILCCNGDSSLRTYSVYAERISELCDDFVLKEYVRVSAMKPLDT